MIGATLYKPSYLISYSVAEPSLNSGWCDWLPLLSASHNTIAIEVQQKCLLVFFLVRHEEPFLFHVIR